MASHTVVATVRIVFHTVVNTATIPAQIAEKTPEKLVNPLTTLVIQPMIVVSTVTNTPTSPDSTSASTPMTGTRTPAITCAAT